MIGNKSRSKWLRTGRSDLKYCLSANYTFALDLTSLAVSLRMPTPSGHEISIRADYWMPPLLLQDQHAWATIAATDTDETTGGLFRSLEKQFIPESVQMPYRDANNRLAGQFHIQGTSRDRFIRAYVDMMESSEMLRRGWVFQEWLLSPRLIAFSDAGPILVCLGGMPRSTIIGPLYNTPTSAGPLSIREALRRDLKAILPGDRWAEGVFRSWRTVVRKYSTLTITDPDHDRLVALAGPASEYEFALIREIRVPKYVCGLWYDDLILGLSWELIGNFFVSRRLKGFPTWSWVSMYGEEQKADGYCVGMGVRWAGVGRRVEEQCSVLDSLVIPTKQLGNSMRSESHAQFDQVPSSKFSESSMFSESERSSSSGFSSIFDESQYKNSHRFVALKLSARRSLVHIRSYFACKEDAEAISNLTTYRTEEDHDHQRDMWRAVCLPKSPETICGWASVEEPRHQLFEAHNNHDHTCRDSFDGNYSNELQGQSQALLEDLGPGSYGYGPDPTLRVDALLLGRIPNCPGGFAVGNIWWNSVPVFLVLFVQEVQKPGLGARFYKRVGVGRLFGPEAEKFFDAAGEDVMWLI